MGVHTTHAITKINDALLRNTAFTPPATLFLALHDGDPGAAGSANEIVGGGYVRQAITFTAGWISAALVSFTASGAAYGDLTHVSVWDASTGGNCWRKGAMTTPRTIDDGDTLEFAAGAVVCTEA